MEAVIMECKHENRQQQPTTTELNRVEEEPKEWENEDMPLLMNTSQDQARYQDDNVSNKTPKNTKKIRKDSDEAGPIKRVRITIVLHTPQSIFILWIRRKYNLILRYLSEST